MRYDRAIRAGNFAIRDGFNSSELPGRTILIIGFGRIGRQVARLCLAFNMQVLVSDPFVAARDVEAQGCRTVADFKDALGEVDFVSLHAPKLPDTRYLIGERELARFKRGAWLVNVSRGGLVDDQPRSPRRPSAARSPAPRSMCSSASRCHPITRSPARSASS